MFNITGLEHPQYFLELINILILKFSVPRMLLLISPKWQNTFKAISVVGNSVLIPSQILILKTQVSNSKINFSKSDILIFKC